jgi:hypothetical protein
VLVVGLNCLQDEVIEVIKELALLNYDKFSIIIGAEDRLLCKICNWNSGNLSVIVTGNVIFVTIAIISDWLINDTSDSESLMSPNDRL